MKRTQGDTDSLWTVLLVGPHGERLPGTVVRCNDDVATVVIGVGQSRDWHPGDRIQVYTEPASASQRPLHGRVCSTYKSLGADHVAIDLSVLPASIL